MVIEPQPASDKPHIDADLVRCLIAAQFPQWSDLPVRPVEPGGWDNRTFRLGERRLARLPSAHYYAPKVDKEQAWLPRLAPALPLPIPTPLALGQPGEGYPFRWSIYGWLPGETAAIRPVAADPRFGADLAAFIAALHRVDTKDGPPPGRANFHRGGRLATYDAETRRALALLKGAIDVAAAEAIWDAALASAWTAPPVWIHGDIAPGNVLLTDDRLSAVIDWGQAALGDPACDLAITWTFLEGQGRAAFRAGLPLDPATWARARGWTFWKALIVAAGLPGTNPADADRSRAIIDTLLAESRAV